MTRARSYLTSKGFSITKYENGAIKANRPGIFAGVYCEFCSSNRTISFYLVDGGDDQGYRDGLSYAIRGLANQAKLCPGKACGGE